MRKRFLSIFLVLALCLAYTPAIPKAYAAEVNLSDYMFAPGAFTAAGDGGTVNVNVDFDDTSLAVDLAGGTVTLNLQADFTVETLETNASLIITGDGNFTVGSISLIQSGISITFQGGPGYGITSITSAVDNTSLIFNNEANVTTGSLSLTGNTPGITLTGESVLAVSGACKLSDDINLSFGAGDYYSEFVIGDLAQLTTDDDLVAFTDTLKNSGFMRKRYYFDDTQHVRDRSSATVPTSLTLRRWFEQSTTYVSFTTTATYNGEPQDLITTSEYVPFGVEKVLYGTSTDAVLTSTTSPTEINADTYADLAYLVVSNGDYDDVYATGDATIQQAHVTISALNRNVLLNETAPSLADPQEGVDYTVEGLYGTDTVTNVQLSYRSGGTVVADPDTSTETMYDIWVDAATVGANYLFQVPADMVAGTLFITEYPIATYTEAPTDLNLVYNGQPQALAVAASDQGQVQYEYGGNFYTEAPEETDAGNYTVSVSILGTPGQYSSGGETIVHTTIQPAPAVTIKPVNTTMYVGDTISVSDLYTVDGTLYGNDESALTINILWNDTENPDTGPVVAGQTYEYYLYLAIPPEVGANYDDIVNAAMSGSVTAQNRPSGSGPSNNESYDFTQPTDGPGSGKVEDDWTWGGRANLPKDDATLYMVLANNGISENEDTDLPYPSLGTEYFLASDKTWELPEENPDIPETPVVEVRVCQDNEPFYYANGDGKVDQSTFGNSDFYTVGVGTGDTKIDYANLKTGDVVSNTSFNGVFVTKLQKSNNPTFDADLAKLKSDTIASFRAFELDHPEVFWLNGSIKLRVLTVTLGSEQTSFIFMTLVDDKGFTMRIAEYAAAGSIEAGIKQRDAAVAAIIAQIPAGASDREKIANLNKWFTLNNEYNRSADLSSIGFTPHRSLKSLTGNFGINGPVCDGYSRGFKTVCDRLGIPVVLETGTASIGSHSELHMWMSIRVDGTWYGTDTTWNDPIVKGKDGKVSGYENEKYLLVGNETVVDGAKFGVSHPANKTPGGTTGVLFASLILNPNEIYGYTAIDYDDVKSTDWFFDYVQDVSARGLMNGTSPNLFSPQGTATRGQIVQILYNIAGQPEVEDVKVEGWFGVPATWAMDKGIVAGYPDGDFHGNDPVTREQLATILWAFEGSPAVTGQIGFADAGTISDWAQQPMLWAKLEGILGGKPGNLADPKGTATRAEIATIFSNYMK